MRRLSSKALGEAAEARFLDVAVFLGLIVAKLWGDSRPFDFYVAPNESKSPYRVQVKATRAKKGRGYFLNCKHNTSQVPYTSKEIDFIAAYVVPLELWYIIPVKAVRNKVAVVVYPNGNRSGERCTYERYRENWNLLRR